MCRPEVPNVARAPPRTNPRTGDPNTAVFKCILHNFILRGLSSSPAAATMGVWYILDHLFNLLWAKMAICLLYPPTPSLTAVLLQCERA